MATTSNNKGFRYPAYTDLPDVPRDISYLASDISTYLDTNLPTFGTGVKTFLQTPTSVNLRTAVATTSTGTGSLAFGTAPTISLPIIDNPRIGYSTTVNAGTTTTLTSASNYQQFFTGTLAQTLKLPDVTTLSLGASYYVNNNSTGIVTVQSSGLNTILAMPGGTTAVFTCIAITGTTAASWDADYTGATTITGTGSLVFGTSPLFTTPSLGVATATSINKLTLTTPSTGSTLTIADGKTFTSSNTITLTATDGSTLAIGGGGTLGTAAYTATTAYQASSTTLAGVASLSSSGTGIARNTAGTWSYDTSTYLTTATGAAIGQTMNIGTTAVAINRASADLALTGITSVTGTTTLAINSATTSALTIDSGTTGAINIGTNANAKTITVGNITGATGITLNAGTGGITLTGQTTYSAGNGSNAPIKLTAGTNLTNAAAGAIEYDGSFIYGTRETTSGRGAVSINQVYRLAASGTALPNTISDYFGATSSINLAAGAVYEIEYYTYFTKTTAGTLTWTLTASSAPTFMSGFYIGSGITGSTVASTPTTGYAGSAAAATAVFPATGSLTTAVNHAYHIKVTVQTNLATTFKLQATQSAGTITPLANSYYTVKRISSTQGSFA